MSLTSAGRSGPGPASCGQSRDLRPLRRRIGPLTATGSRYRAGVTDEAGAELQFPDLPKLELDQLIEQLVDRARGVQHAQGRLRALLRAIELITGELGLEAVLRHVVEAATALAGARYGALGVIGHDGTLEQFIHVGIPADRVAEIGQLPQGKGLLGVLISDPRPVRLAHLGQDPRSAGFPPGHPRMDSFIGVPVRVRGQVFGNLYLTESTTGQFSVEDEELVRSLAVAAGTAISNARLYRDSQVQQRWLSASAEISAQLLADSGEDPLHTIARRAHEIAVADVVTVSLVAPGGEDMVVEVAVGSRADELVGRRFARGELLVGKALDDRSPQLLGVSAGALQQQSHLASVLEVGPVLVIPLAGASRALGALTIARRAGRPGFTAADLAMASGFAGQASVALELAEARSEAQRLVLLEDRDRIARDLHDHVIQQLFAIGLSLEGAATRAEADDQVADLLHRRVEDIDRTIRQIRTSIFELRGPLGAAREGVRQRVLALAGELSPVLGFAPHVAFAGAVDAVIQGSLADDVEACVREALTNVGRHAEASTASVDVEATAQTVTVSVLDDGRGIGDTTRSSGLANLRARAERRGGSFDVGTVAAGGTHLIWKAPVS